MGRAGASKRPPPPAAAAGSGAGAAQKQPRPVASVHGGAAATPAKQRAVAAAKGGGAAPAIDGGNKRRRTAALRSETEGIELAPQADVHLLRQVIRDGEAIGLAAEELLAARQALEVEETKAEVLEAARLADAHLLKATIREGEAAGLQDQALAKARQALTELEAARPGSVAAMLEQSSAPRTPERPSGAASVAGASTATSPSRSSTEKKSAKALAELLIGAMTDGAAVGSLSAAAGREGAGDRASTFEQVGQFNEAFRIPALRSCDGDFFREDAAFARRQLDLVAAEARELERACASENARGVVEALASTVFTAYSVGRSLGVDLEAAVRGVLDSNMSMLFATRAEAEDFARRYRGQCPKGCPAPSIAVRGAGEGRWAVYNERTGEVLKSPSWRPMGAR